MNGYLVPVVLIIIGLIFAYRSSWLVKPERSRPVRIVGLIMLLIGVNWLVFKPLFNL